MLGFLQMQLYLSFPVYICLALISLSPGQTWFYFSNSLKLDGINYSCLSFSNRKYLSSQNFYSLV